MRYVAFAALAGAFWMSVATMRLMIHGVPSAGPSAQFRSSPPEWGERLPHAEVEAVLEALRARIAACEDHASTGKVTVDLHIAPDGTVRSANHLGEIAGTGPATCVTNLLLSTRFRPSQAGYEASHSFDMR